MVSSYSQMPLAETNIQYQGHALGSSSSIFTPSGDTVTVGDLVYSTLILNSVGLIYPVCHEPTMTSGLVLMPALPNLTAELPKILTMQILLCPKKSHIYKDRPTDWRSLRSPQYVYLCIYLTY